MLLWISQRAETGISAWIRRTMSENNMEKQCYHVNKTMILHSSLTGLIFNNAQQYTVFNNIQYSTPYQHVCI